jgi:oligopeptide transport system permease protein
MLRFFTSRLLQSCIALLVIISATFFMLRLVPGGPFTQERAVPAEIQRALDAHYHLDEPLWRQYTRYLGDLLPNKFSPGALADGFDLEKAFGIDFGPSFRYSSRTVNEIIADKFPVSIDLGLTSLAIALLLGISLGVLAAARRNTWADYTASSISMIGISTPTFVIGPIAVLLFAIYVRWVPASGWVRWDEIENGTQTLSDLIRSRVLPCLVLGFAFAAPIARLTRGGMLDVLNQDFIRTARAKGASELRVIGRHALRGGLLPVVAYLGPAIAGIITGSFVIETIFQIPGLGREFVTSAFNRDYTLVLGTVTLYAVLIMALNLAADLIQAWMNPKIRLEN